MKKLYIVKTGCLNRHTNQYTLTNFYYTSKKSAFQGVKQILEINEATEKKEGIFKPEIWEKVLYSCDYKTPVDNGQRIAKARLILEQDRFEFT